MKCIHHHNYTSTINKDYSLYKKQTMTLEEFVEAFAKYCHDNKIHKDTLILSKSSYENIDSELNDHGVKFIEDGEDYLQLAECEKPMNITEFIDNCNMLSSNGMGDCKLRDNYNIIISKNACLTGLDHDNNYIAEDEKEVLFIQ